MNSPKEKYKPFSVVKLHDRTWPDNAITRPPIWCSVCLRDGNQALIQPMRIEEKLEMFNMLVGIGFKEIEVGFPAASQVEFDFVRMLVEKNLIPEDVTIQVLTQSREDLIKRTFESLYGVKKAIVHQYNSTSELQRRVVFRKSRGEIVNLAVAHTEIIREEVEKSDSNIRFEYSPESFTGTELNFAIEICEAVMDIWGSTSNNPMIINLPATVEMATPNVYADQIEWFIRNLKNRESAIISLHAHNDRGSAVAATELALMAGADRVEGTLFGNGERTGNVDIITLALNMHTQGVDSGLDFSNIDQIIEIYERCTRMSVHNRHPYAGELVYTAFSGSHQDAISKGMRALENSGSPAWEVPYLPLDPKDVGRTYEATVIRINSQSGKGGVAYVMKAQFGCDIPKRMQPDFGSIIQNMSEKNGRELLPQEIRDSFHEEYVLEAPYKFKKYKDISPNGGSVIEATIIIGDGEKKIVASGDGQLDAFCVGLRSELRFDFVLEEYFEHALSAGSDAAAIAYVLVNFSGEGIWGVGIDKDILRASMKAVLSAVNKSL